MIVPFTYIYGSSICGIEVMDDEHPNAQELDAIRAVVEEWYEHPELQERWRQEHEADMAQIAAAEHDAHALRVHMNMFHQRRTDQARQHRQEREQEARDEELAQMARDRQQSMDRYNAIHPPQPDLTPFFSTAQDAEDHHRWQEGQIFLAELAVNAIKERRAQVQRQIDHQSNIHGLNQLHFLQTQRIDAYEFVPGFVPGSLNDAMREKQKLYETRMQELESDLQNKHFNNLVNVHKDNAPLLDKVMHIIRLYNQQCSSNGVALPPFGMNTFWDPRRTWISSIVTRYLIIYGSLKYGGLQAEAEELQRQTLDAVERMLKHMWARSDMLLPPYRTQVEKDTMLVKLAGGGGGGDRCGTGDLYHNAEEIRLLILDGADPNATVFRGASDSALIKAAIRNNHKAAKVLLVTDPPSFSGFRRADVNFINAENKSAVDYAIIGGNDLVLQEIMGATENRYSPEMPLRNKDAASMLARLRL